ncbi:MAG: DegT/DnrJ/EryC1/StrS family aminotransferase, partial [Planctomycetales bacterium]|nr:DegT/DnrJ/EryC1/StrS family aminotransferase [Planctomycetales bacterium]
LLLALMAIDVGPGDEVIVPSFTFFATASCVWRLGATPVFVDIDSDSFNICPDKIADAINSKTKAIIPVHLFGRPADMDEIMSMARALGIVVIEDCAQSIGAQYNGWPTGGIGHMGCTSFYPTKNLGGYGDGGMITTSDDALAIRLRDLRAHGMNPRYYHREVGINSRLDSIQAAVLNVKIQQLADWTAARTENADRYDRLFQEAEICDAIKIPSRDEKQQSVWNQYTIRVLDGQRDSLRHYLMQCGVGSEVYYPVPLHQQECFRELGYASGSLPATEQAAAEVLSLPIFPELTEDEQRTVVHHIQQFFSTARLRAAA